MSRQLLIVLELLCGLLMFCVGAVLLGLFLMESPGTMPIWFLPIGAGLLALGLVYLAQVRRDARANARHRMTRFGYWFYGTAILVLFAGIFVLVTLFDPEQRRAPTAGFLFGLVMVGAVCEWLLSRLGLSAWTPTRSVDNDERRLR